MGGVALLFPPGTDPRSPYLALPSLAAALRRSGIEVRMHDLDISGLWALMTPAHLNRAGMALERSSAVHEAASVQRLCRSRERLAEAAMPALQRLRSAAHFYDPNHFNAARETLSDAVDLVAAATSARVRYAITPPRYDVTGVNVQRLADLETVTANDECNVFAEYWEDALYPALRRQDPELVGITITNAQQVVPGLTLARRLKSIGYYVVLGGALYAKFTDRFKTLPAFFRLFADGVIPYEGETALVSLVDALRRSHQFRDVPNLLFLEGDIVRSGPTHVEDVTTLPCPDFDGLPLDKYLTPEPVLPTYFGKGCYYNRCKFCDIPYINHISTKAYRLRSPEQLVSDLLTMKRLYGCRHFEFTDEALPPRTLEHLADALRPHESENFRFVGYARLEPVFTPALCTKLARMGVRKLYFGLESASQETLDHMDKGIRVTDVPGVLTNCSNAGIRFHLFTIVGFPEETRARAHQTFEFLRDHADILGHPGNSFDMHPFGLELRTAYFQESCCNGAIIAPDVLKRDFVIGVGNEWSNTRGLSPAEVEDLLNEYYEELRRTFRRTHAAPQHLWPAFEEFALLYADHYFGVNFRFATSLPDDDDPHRYRLRWSPAAHVEKYQDDFFVVMGRNGEVLIDARTFALMAGIKFQPVDDLLTTLAASVPESPGGNARTFVRETIDALVQRGLVQIEPERE